MNMRLKALKAACALVVVAAAGLASAQTFTGGFPTNSSTVVGSVGHIDGSSVGWFWSASRGDMVGQSYSTGLGSIVQLDLELNVATNNLVTGNQVDWDVRVNGISVGSWSRTAAQGTGHVSLSYSFAPISDGGGNYLIEMFVTNEVPTGAGSISLAKNGSTDTMTVTAVPEPASMAALGLGAAFLAARRRRKK